jgi:hypothetical protein
MHSRWGHEAAAKTVPHPLANKAKVKATLMSFCLIKVI